MGHNHIHADLDLYHRSSANALHRPTPWHYPQILSAETLSDPALQIDPGNRLNPFISENGVLRMSCESSPSTQTANAEPIN
jgi:hypothetical protein